jgi:hypothetical protein
MKRTVIKIVILSILVLATAALWLWFPGQYREGRIWMIEEMTLGGDLNIPFNIKVISFGLFALTLIFLFYTLASVSKKFLKLGPIFAFVFGIAGTAAVFFYNNYLHMLYWNGMIRGDNNNSTEPGYRHYLLNDLKYRYGLTIFRYILLLVIITLACLVIWGILSGWFRKLIHTDRNRQNTAKILAILFVIVLTTSLVGCKNAPKSQIDALLEKYKNTSIDVLKTDSGNFLKGLLDIRETITLKDFKNWSDNGILNNAYMVYKDTTLFGKPIRIDAYCYNDPNESTSIFFKYELDSQTNMDIGLELCNRSIELLGEPDSINIMSTDSDDLVESTLAEYREGVDNGTIWSVTMFWPQIWLFVDYSQVSWYIVRAPRI